MVRDRRTTHFAAIGAACLGGAVLLAHRTSLGRAGAVSLSWAPERAAAAAAFVKIVVSNEYFRRADLSPMNRGDAAAATWKFGRDRRPRRILDRALHRYGGQPNAISRGVYKNIQAIAEPYKNTTLTAAGDAPSYWRVYDRAGKKNVLERHTSDRSISHVFSRVSGVFDVEVRSVTGAASALTVTCKYRGRAEISSIGPGCAPSFKRQPHRRLSNATPAGTSGES